MFKKFKDKLAEEMKQSPARLQASMQQMAQAVISPAQSNSSIQELPMTVESDLTKKTDDVVKNNSIKNTFQNVELVSPLSNSVDVSRRSSVNSVTSDVTSLFPLYESPKNLYHIQSDIDQSATEIDDDINTQFDRVTKDQLYLAYKKIQAKYHKYRGRYTDLVKHYRDLERVKTKLESVLVETQDNVLRRVGDLKEQCQLEQQAKAHLEEVLRNDIEEKNHIIDTLNTKIKLLQGNVLPTENLMLLDSDEGHNSTADVMEPNKELTDNAGDSSTLSAENTQLKNKLIKLEAVVVKYKNTSKRTKNLIKKYKEIFEENNTLKCDYEALKSSSLENAEILQKELSIARDEISNLTEQVNTLKRREEESVISLAENKLSIHRELEGKEEQIKQLQFDLKHTMENKENLTEIVEKYKTELEQLKIQYNIQNLDGDKKDNIQDILKGYAESIESHNILKESDALNENEMLDKLKHDLTEKEAELQKVKVTLQETQTLSKEYQCDIEKFQNELSNLKIKYVELKKEHDAQIIITDERRKEAETTIEKLQMTVQSLDKELENMRYALSDRDQVCETFNLKMQEYASMLEKANNQLLVKDLEIKKLNDQLSNENEITKLQNKIGNKEAELLELHNKLKYYKDTISELTQQIDIKSSKIDLLNKEKISFTNKLLCFKMNTEKLREDCTYLRNNVKEIFQDHNNKISSLNSYLQNILMEKENVKKEVEILHTKLKTSEQQINKLMKVETELAKVKQQKTVLESELKEYKTKIEHMKQEVESHNKSNIEINRFITEIDNLNFKIHDLQQMQVLMEKQKENEIGHLEKGMIEMKKKYEDATNVIKTLEDKKSECNLLQEELEHLKSKILYLHNNNTKNDIEINELREKILKKESEIVDLQIKFQDHVKLVEEYSKKNAELENIYQNTNKDHMEETMKLNSSNNILQEMIDRKNVQLNKLEVIKEQQDKNLLYSEKKIQDLTVALDEFRNENLNMSQTIETLSKEIETLKNENHQLETLRTENELINTELVQLKSISDKISEENTNLNIKQSELIQSHEKLNKMKETLNVKILEYQKNKEDLLYDMEGLQKDIDSYKQTLNVQNEELKYIKNQLQETNTKVDSQTKILQERNKELQKTKQEFEEQTQQLSDKTTALDLALKDMQLLQEEKNILSDNVMKLEEQLTDLKARNFNKTPFKHINETLTNIQLEKLKNGELILDEHLANLSASTVLNLDSENKHLMAKIKNIENIMEQEISKLKLLEEKEKNLLQENEELKLLNTKELQQKIIEIDTLKTTMKKREDEINGLQLQIESLTDLKDKLDSKLQTADDNNKMVEQNLVEKSNRLQEENKKLEADLDEAIITFHAKESQMYMINNQLKEELKMHEEEQNIRLKQLVKEFQAQLQDKEEELQSALEKRFDYQQSYESNLLQQYKEQLKDFQVELTTKSEQLENLILENKKLTTEKENEVKALTESIASIRKEHVNELREIEQKWKTILQQRSDRLEAKHEEEIKELTREWRNERKLETKIDTATEELENTSCIAMAAIQSNTGSFHTFQQTLASQSRELVELRKLVKLRHETLEDSTEIEYLRNILYEYMMGKETMVLAKVIAAVVKFDQEQTAKILKKEEDKLTLLGSLGLT
ncbi:golgin subfamily A member 4-like isoform X2 [Vespa crabro]|uniref:golgin subfamily A member 4-like isoform X2 n=1 Tax=Vespa crabro TaxID=7445 RepID=UPI001F0077D4|nr:golgin subfamily A member 4-like isoform X2 [Vespa crabro]